MYPIPRKCLALQYNTDNVLPYNTTQKMSCLTIQHRKCLALQYNTENVLPYNTTQKMSCLTIQHRQCLALQYNTDNVLPYNTTQKATTDFNAVVNEKQIIRSPNPNGPPIEILRCVDDLDKGHNDPGGVWHLYGRRLLPS